MSVMIQLSELHFSSDDGIKVLEDVHLHVDRGEMVMLVGPPASGKSILLGLLGTQIRPQLGQILVHGRNIARLSRAKVSDLRRQIGFLPQNFVPLPKTVLENVAFKLRALGDFREQAEEKALAALEIVGLTGRLASETSELEPLDRVRLGIALAICDEPLLLLLDEPFDALAAEDQQAIWALLREVHLLGHTMVIATRGPLPGEVDDARIVRLSDGKVIE
jgi:ABC-type ATPase involved in cell division